MISLSIITAPQDAAAYYSDLAKAAEYYGGERVPSQWLGQGAEIQGFNGAVRQEHLTAQLEGKVVDSSGVRQLGVFRNGSLQHRAGYDFTVSAPKSVSIEALVFDNRDIIKAHNTAVNEAFEYLESNAAQSRINGQVVKTGNLTAAAYQHVSSRAGDPQLHTHLIISNVTYDNKGKAYSLSSERLFEYRKTADAIYHNKLSHELQKLGYGVSHDSHGRVELADYSSESIRDFSARRQEIEQALAARGIDIDHSTAAARQAACLATRPDKNLPETREAHAERWTSQAAALGLSPANRQGSTQEIYDGPQQQAREALQSAIVHLGERAAQWTERDLHREAARFSEGRASWGAIGREIEKAEQAGALVRESGQTTDHLTTAAARCIESNMVEVLEDGLGSHRGVMSKDEFAAELQGYEQSRGFQLTAEQAAAGRMILTGADTFQGIQGLAGTGKTTLLEFVRVAAESKGWSVVGHSNGAAQAETLQRESGIHSTTTAAFLRSAEVDYAKGGAVAPPDRILHIMDEAGQAGQADFSRVLTVSNGVGARTVFVGDVRQHEAVAAGTAFKIAARHMPMSELGRSSIRRQRTEETQRAVAHILDGHHDRAVKSVACVAVTHNRNSLAAGAGRDDLRGASKRDNLGVIAKLAADYGDLSAEQRASTLVVTSTNADRERLNDAIRGRLKARGELGASVAVKTVTKTGLTQQELKRAANYEPGQVVEVMADSQRQELARGSQWTVTGQRAGVLDVVDASGQSRTMDPSRCRLQAYDIRIRDVAVGDRLRWVENHRAQRADFPLEAGLKVRNGELAEVVAVSDGRVTLLTPDGEEIHLDPSVPQKLDFSYVSTSHAAQGLTVDSVMVHHNTEAGAHGARETYVDLTRARDSVVLYTQNPEKAAAQSGLDLDKSAALDLTPDQFDTIPAAPDHGHDLGHDSDAAHNLPEREHGPDGPVLG